MKKYTKGRGLLLLVIAFLLFATLAACDDGPGTTDVPKEPIPDYYYARGEGKEFVPTKHYPADDLIICTKNVMKYGAKADGVTDDSAAFKKALNAVKSNGGGTLYVPAGTYYLSEQVVIPDAVTLCGDWVSPEEEPAGTKGTILITDYKSRTAQTQYCFIKMGSSSGLRNVTIYHKNQDVANPKKMAATVGAITQSQPSVENVTILNAYTAFSFGEGKSTNCSLVGLVNVYVSALQNGVILNNSYDVSRFENLNVSPRYLAENVIEPMTEDEKKALYDYTFANCVGVTLYRGDATGLYDTYLELCKIGILLDEDPNGNGVTSGAITLTEIRNCNVGIQINGAHGIGTALTGFTATADRPCLAAIQTGPRYTNNTKVEDGKIGGSYRTAAIVGSKALVSFTAMDFDLATTDYILQATAGTVSCVGCRFNNDKIFTDKNGQAAAYFFGCEFAKGAEKSVTNRSVFQRDDKAVSMPEIKEYHVYKDVLPMPATRKIVSITQYGAVGDGKTDNTKAIQDALDAMKAEGGGIVMIPTGRFVVKGYLTVPSGVELAGMLGVWCYNGSALDNSCLLLYAGANDPKGQAAISLEKGSGIRGFLAWYPEQNYDKIVKYSYAVRSLGPDTYAINVNICNPYQFMDLGTHDSTGHYVRNCAGIAIKTGFYVGNNSGEGWLENVHLNQHQPYELFRKGESGGYDPARFNDLVFGTFINQTEYFVFGYNENEHVLGAFGLGAKAVFRFVEQDGKSTSGTFIQCGADGCSNSFVIEQAGTLNIIAPGDVSLGEAIPRTYFTTEKTFTGTMNLFGGAGFGSPSNCIMVQGGTVNINTFTFASSNQAIPLSLIGGKSVNLVNCVIPFSGKPALSKIMKKFEGTATEFGTVMMDNGRYGYLLSDTFE